MPRRTAPGPLAAGVRGIDSAGKVVVLAKTQPRQLVLFQTFLADHKEEEDDKYSNTVELYDAIPKYFSNPKILEEMRRDGIYLPILERTFKHHGETYKVKLRPARLEDVTGAEKEYYPTHREELVEDALRKLACDRVNGVYLDDLAGVQFTLYALKKELKSQGHDIELTALITALRICNRVTLSLYRNDGKIVLESSLFPILLLGSKKDWLQHPHETKCYVQFHPLVTQCISHLSYRQFDYGTYMRYRYRLSRWLHKRLAHNYTQAGLMHPYTIRLSTILRDSGTHCSPRNHDNAKRVEAALAELHEHNTLLSLTKETLRGPRKSIVDIKYSILPTLEFIEEVKKANRRSLRLKEHTSTGSPKAGIH
jgi:hypothetical protein